MRARFCWSAVAHLHRKHLLPRKPRQLSQLQHPAAPAFDLAASLAGDSRSDEDRARDAGRKPAEVLALLGVEPGMAVIDLMAAGGWYSEVLSHAVGADGSVTAQNPPFILGFRDGAYGVALDERIGDRLTNVTRLDSTWAELGASGAQYDAAMSALNLHDAYYLQSPEAAAELAAAVLHRSEARWRVRCDRPCR